MGGFTAKLEVLTPEEKYDIVGDLNRRGQVNDMGIGSKVVKADVPLSEMFGYVTSLRTLSSGRATSDGVFPLLQPLLMFLKTSSKKQMEQLKLTKYYNMSQKIENKIKVLRSQSSRQLC